MMQAQDRAGVAALGMITDVTLQVVDDRIVIGQNQYAGAETAQKKWALLVK